MLGLRVWFGVRGGVGWWEVRRRPWLRESWMLALRPGLMMEVPLWVERVVDASLGTTLLCS